MPKARKIINEASFGPETLKTLGDVFDKVWAVLAPEFGDDLREIEAARLRLATIVLKLAKDGQLGPLQITRTAARACPPTQLDQQRGPMNNRNA